MMVDFENYKRRTIEVFGGLFFDETSNTDDFLKMDILKKDLLKISP